MPRPKRTKVASAQRVEQPVKAVSGRRKPIQTAPGAQDNASDDSDGLVTKAKTTRAPGRMPWHLPRVHHTEEELMMTGGLPADEKEVQNQRKPARAGRGRPKKVQSSIQHNAALDALKNRRDAALKAKEAQQGAQKEASTPKTTTIPKPTEASSTSAKATKINKMKPQSPMVDVTEETLLSSSPVTKRPPPSALKAHGTPAMETSILTNFRRRPRQPSILRMVQQTTDDDEHDDLNNLDDLDDFNPDDESTPLQLHKRKSGGEHSIGNNSASSSALPSSASRKRKLASPEIQVPRSSPPPVQSPTSSVIEGSQPSESPELPVPDTEAPEDAVRSLEEPMSETMAPPRSSSPVEADMTSGIAPSGRRQARAKKKDQQNSNNDGKDEANAGESVKDRVTRRRGKTATKAKASAISTARLQSLLPQRKRITPGKTHDQFDIPGSDEFDASDVDSDEDELGMTPMRATRRMHKSTKSPIKKGRGFRKPRGAPAKGNTKTYGNRRASSDKENTSTFVAEDVSEDEDEPTEISIMPVDSVELQAAAKKFQEVDEWEMEFESVDVGGVSSSPWR